MTIQRDLMRGAHYRSLFVNFWEPNLTIDSNLRKLWKSEFVCGKPECFWKSYQVPWLIPSLTEDLSLCEIIHLWALTIYV
jgi:hypothetical protein